MNRRRIKVAKVGQGLFASERSVTLQVGEDIYNLIVDEHDVQPDDTLEVTVVAAEGDQALVDLPRETFTSGNRIRVPTSALLPAA